MIQPSSNQPQRQSITSRRKIVLVSALVIALVAIAIGILGILGVFTRNVLDRNNVEANVRQILNQNFGETDIQSVSCPPNQSMQAGSSFTCVVRIGENNKNVKIEVTNDRGDYQVDAPN